VFDDPQVVLGMVLGLALIVLGTFLGVRGHLRRERHAASLEEEASR
jgi:hypothetical protein